MIKKLKIGLPIHLKISVLGLLIAVLAVFGIASCANAAALTWSADYTVDLSAPDVNLTILSSSEATSLVVGTGSIAVVVPSGDTFTVTSASRDLAVGGDSNTEVTTTCNAGTAKVEVYGGTVGDTITIAPTDALCDDSTGDTGGSTGGGSHPITPPVVPPVVPPSGGGGLCPNGNTIASNCATAPTTSSATTYDLGTTTLQNGSMGDAVKELQRFLNVNLNLSLVVDGILGPNTVAAIKLFQSANSLLADGIVGPATKAAMLALVNAVPPVVPPTGTYNFGTAVLQNGSTGDAVKELQRFLNATLNLGLVVDGIFGPHTTSVMKQWQTEHNLVADGLVGPLTKAAMLVSI